MIVRDVASFRGTHGGELTGGHAKFGKSTSAKIRHSLSLCSTTRDNVTQSNTSQNRSHLLPNRSADVAMLIARAESWRLD